MSKQSSAKHFQMIHRDQLSTITGGGHHNRYPVCPAMFCVMSQTGGEPSRCEGFSACRCEPIDPMGTSGICVGEA
ncbi:hypothetical protein KTO58_14740 [Chitinophaga pendula]|uniref:hypothetical protein n=1 Tax=Chitinophaga TaxID=79328 RepID=UPI0012FD9001|nr:MULTISPECIES: hypothetical protein [Chitinophaga]UCJ04958.1 hypothetical protein KTO58_14740 [Chitinophaga pendula]